MDGHYWIVNCGQIIDWDFDEYELDKKFWGCTSEKVYLEASPLIQAVFIKRMLNKYETANKTLGSEVVINDLSRLKPMYGQCQNNVLAYYVKHGGRIVFGSMGWKKKTGGIHYEFGGVDYTINNFLRR